MFRMWLVGVVAVVALSGCVSNGPRVQGSGVAATELRAVPAFQRVRVEGQGQLLVRVGGDHAVEISADDNLLPYVQTEVTGDTLTVRMQRGNSYGFRHGLSIVIDAPMVTEVAQAGSFGGEVRGVHGETFDASIAGSGNMRVDGDVDALAASIAGSGDLDLSELRTREAAVRISGSGDIAVNVTGPLDASIGGSGDVLYTGEPSLGNVKISGSGSVRRR